MAKRIVGFVPIGDGSRDRGEEMIVFEFFDDHIEEIDTNVFGMKKGVKNSVPIKSIVRVDCFKGSELRNESAEGAVLGGLLFGVAGAIIGGMASSHQTAWFCEILTLSGKGYFRLNSELDKNFILKWAKKLNIQIGQTEFCAPAFGFNNGKDLHDYTEKKVKEIEQEMDAPIEVNICDINARLTALGELAASEFYRHKKHIEYFTKEDILRLEAMERSAAYKK